MKIKEIKDLLKEKPFGQEVEICGWIKTARDQKRLVFIEVFDGSQFNALQVVAQEDCKGLPFEEIIKLKTGASITVKGEFIKGERAPEIKASCINLLADCPSDYPLQKKRHSLEFLRTIPHIRPRANTLNAVFRIRSTATFAVNSFFYERGFVLVHTPILTGVDAEGAGELFRVRRGENDDYFGKETFLGVTGQLAVEPFAMAFRKVYTFGPIFRAEPSTTTVHASEFWMIEPEMAFLDLDACLENIKDFLKYVTGFVFKENLEEIEFLNKYVEPTLLDRLSGELKFERISYTNAVETLKKEAKNADFDFPIEWGLELKSEHERYLCEKIFNRPVFVTDYPKELKAFYMRLNEDEATVACTDLLTPGIGELVGGSQREERENILRSQMAQKGLNPEIYEWYVDIRRFGGVVHSGYGVGFERLLMYLTGMKNIRDVIPYPRTYGQISF